MNNPPGRRFGLVLLGLLSLGDIATIALTDGEHPPYAVAALAAALGAVSLVLVISALRDPSRPLRLLIGLRLLSAVMALPAFFISDVPAGAQAAAGAIVVLSAVGIVLVSRCRTPVVAS